MILEAFLLKQSPRSGHYCVYRLADVQYALTALEKGDIGAVRKILEDKRAAMGQPEGVSELLRLGSKDHQVAR